MAEQLNIRTGEELSAAFEHFAAELGAPSKRDAFERMLELARQQFIDTSGEDDADNRAIKSLLARVQSSFIAGTTRRREAERTFEEHRAVWRTEKGELLATLEEERTA